MKRLNQNKKQFVIPLILIALLILIGYFAFAYFSKSTWPFVTPTIDTDSSQVYSAPTEQELTDSQDAKKNNADQETKTPSETISIAIAYADYDNTEDAIDIRAFTPDVIEADATCTATLTHTNKTVTKTSKSFIDSTSSQCEPILINRGEFPEKGTWELIVSYTSDKYKGSSSPINIEVSQ